MEMIKMGIKMYLEYVGDSLHMVLFAGALLYIALREEERQHRKLFLGYTLGFVFVYFCPVTAWAIQKFIGDTYWRMFWLLPMPAVMAYAMTRAWNRCTGWWRRAALLSVFAGAICLGGQNVYLQDTPFERAYNSEKIPQAAAVLCDIIHENLEEGERAKLAAPEDMTWFVRQYDGSIRQIYGRRMKSSSTRRYIRKKLSTEGAKFSVKKMTTRLRKLKCNFVAMPDAPGRIDKMKKYEFEVIGQVGSYVIYKDRQGKEA